MKRPVWRGAVAQRNDAPTDSASHAVARLAAGIAERARGVFAGQLEADAGAPERTATAAPSGDRTRVWRCEAGGASLHLLVDDAAARTLLHAALGGPAAPDFTPLERDILRETVERLCVAPRVRWTAVDAAPVAPADAWRCEVRIRADGDRPASLVLVAAAASARPRTNPRTIDPRRIPITVTAALTASRVPLSAVAALTPGALVPLACDALAVRLWAGAVHVGFGRLGVCGAKRAVCIEAPPEALA